MVRPLMMVLISAVAWWPAVVEAHEVGSRGNPIAGRGPGRRQGTINWPIGIIGHPYFIAPLGGAPYSLPPSTIFQPFPYVIPSYTVAPYPWSPALKSAKPGRVEGLVQEVETLRREVQRLRDAGHRLRESRQGSQTSQQEVPPTVPTEPSMPVVLVFRDGRRIEVPGYIAAGEILWVVTEQSSMLIQLSDLNLEATQKLNAERGIRFPLLH